MNADGHKRNIAKVVIEQPVECPGCRGTDTKVYKTDSKQRPIKRYRRCDDCGYTFTSLVPKFNGKSSF